MKKHNPEKISPRISTKKNEAITDKRQPARFLAGEKKSVGSRRPFMVGQRVRHIAGSPGETGSKRSKSPGMPDSKKEKEGQCTPFQKIGESANREEKGRGLSK